MSREIRWEYTDKNGRQAFTDWYDADNHSVRIEPDKLIVQRTGGGCAVVTVLLLSVPAGLVSAMFYWLGA